MQGPVSRDVVDLLLARFVADPLQLGGLMASNRFWRNAVQAWLVRSVGRGRFDQVFPLFARRCGILNVYKMRGFYETLTRHPQEYTIWVTAALRFDYLDRLAGHQRESVTVARRVVIATGARDGGETLGKTLSAMLSTQGKIERLLKQIRTHAKSDNGLMGMLLRKSTILATRDRQASQIKECARVIEEWERKKRSAEVAFEEIDRQVKEDEKRLKSYDWEDE